MHPWLRWLLVNIVIVPRRASLSAHAYQKIWTKDGPPLVVHSKNFAAKLQAYWGEGVKVHAAMLNGHPSVLDVINTCLNQGVQRLVIVPMFPQSASATTGAAWDVVTSGLRERAEALGDVHVMGPFSDHPGFIDPFAASIREIMEKTGAEHLLMSYHGLPIRQLKCACLCTAGGSQTAPTMPCACYRAQCYRTSKALALSLSLDDAQITIAFQSRLGRAAWIAPYTEASLAALRARGIKNLAVVCPSFVADCLETLEEIGMRVRDAWLAAGGGALHLVPCPNAHDAWVQGFASIMKTRGLC
jgi:ferrochelatase